MNRATKTAFRVAVLAFAVRLAAPGCDTQGVPFVPTDTVGVDTAADSAAADTPGGLDTGPPWDWWDGDLLVWRAEQIPLQEVFHDISGVEDDAGYAVFVVGFRGAVVRYDSAEGMWADVSPATNRSVEGVWAAGPDLTWICGEQGLLMRYQAPPGATYPEWVDETDPLREETLRDVHGSGPDDVWAVGDGGLVLRNQGDGWVEIPSADLRIPDTLSGDLNAVYARGPDDVWIAGQGTVIRWNGIEWGRQDVSESDDFLSVTGSEDYIWIGSDAGYLWRFDGETWMKKSPAVYYDYDAIWVDDDGTVYATGEDPSPQSIIWVGLEEPSEQLDVASPDGVPEQWAVTQNSLVTGLWGRGSEDLFACTRQQQILRYAKHR